MERQVDRIKEERESDAEKLASASGAMRKVSEDRVRLEERLREAEEKKDRAEKELAILRARCDGLSGDEGEEPDDTHNEGQTS
jgi:hypothetical protein